MSDFQSKEFAKWLNELLKEVKKERDNARSKSEKTYYLDGVLFTLHMIKRNLEFYGLTQKESTQQDFDVIIKLNAVAKDEDEVKDKVHPVLTAVAETGLSNIIQIRKVGEYMD